MQCAKCGSEKIMQGLRISDYKSEAAVENLSIKLYEHPKRIFAKTAIEVSLHANVCGNCGYVELLVPNPEELWKVYCRLHEEEEFAKHVAKDEEEFAKCVAKDEEEFAKWIAKDPARSYLSKKEQLSLYHKSLSKRLIKE